MRAMSTLDRYVLSSWVRIFVLTALGLPIVSILINLTDTLNRLLDRRVGLVDSTSVLDLLRSGREDAAVASVRALG